MTESAFTLPAFALACKKKNRLFHLLSFEIQSVLESITRLATLILTMTNQYIFEQLLTVMNLHQHAKNQFIPFAHSLDRVNFRVPSHEQPHPFLTAPTPKIFNVLLTCMYLYQHEKGQLILEL